MRFEKDFENDESQKKTLNVSITFAKSKSKKKNDEKRIFEQFNYICEVEVEKQKENDEKRAFEISN